MLQMRTKINIEYIADVITYCTLVANNWRALECTC